MASPTFPDNPNVPARRSRGRNDAINAFREEVDHFFVRYQGLYDRSNYELRRYRLNHVQLVGEIFNELMIALGSQIEDIRQVTSELDALIDDRRTEVGNNACVQGVVSQRNANSDEVGISIQNCVIYANTTLHELLTTSFYPTFIVIQDQTSQIPISVIDILSRGNVLEDEQEILQYMDDRYRAIEMQWFTAVSQLFRWETSRFNVEGRFLADQTAVCMLNAALPFMLTNSRLGGEVRQC